MHGKNTAFHARSVNRSIVWAYDWVLVVIFHTECVLSTFEVSLFHWIALYKSAFTYLLTYYWPWVTMHVAALWTLTNGETWKLVYKLADRWFGAVNRGAVIVVPDFTVFVVLLLLLVVVLLIIINY